MHGLDSQHHHISYTTGEEPPQHMRTQNVNDIITLTRSLAPMTEGLSTRLGWRDEAWIYACHPQWVNLSYDGIPSQHPSTPHSLLRQHAQKIMFVIIKSSWR